MPSTPPRNDLRIALTDEYGTLYVDPNGYGWRGPEYKARYDVLSVADPSARGGWTRIGDWYKSVNTIPEFEPSSFEKLYKAHLDPGAAAKSTAAGAAGLVLLGGALYVAAQVLPVVLSRRSAAP